jgi:putative SOS response-associated peptidase YedK
MPAILAPEDEEAWLSPSRHVHDVIPLLRPYESDRIEAYAVSRQVNAPTFDDPSCVERNEE